MVQIRCKNVNFYSKMDEEAFFAWVAKIYAILTIKGVGDEILFSIESTNIDENSLYELIGLLTRYKINLKQLAQFKTAENADWFYNKQKYWFKAVFG